MACARGRSRVSLLVGAFAGALLGGHASAQEARGYFLEFFDEPNIANSFQGVYVNGHNDVGLTATSYNLGEGTFIVINQSIVYDAGAAGEVNPGTQPDQMGFSTDGGWAYGSFLGVTTNQTVITDVGPVLSEGDEFLPGLFAADSVFGVRMTDDGTVFVVADLGPAAGDETDRGLVRIRDYRTTPFFDVVLVGGLSGPGTDVGGGLTIGSNQTVGTLPQQGGINTTYNVSQNGRYLLAGVDVQGAGVTTANDGAVVLTDLTTGLSTVVLREGDPTGDGDAFDNLGFTSTPLQVNNAGHTLVAGDTDGDTAQDAYLALNGAIVAREGQTVDGVTLSSVGGIALNNHAQFACVWSGKNGTPETLFFGTAADGLRAIISVGDTFSYFDDLEGQTLNATITDIESEQIALTDDGRAYLSVEFDDGLGFEGFYGVIEVDVPAPPACVADQNADGNLNNTDINLFVGNFLAQDPAADVNADGNWNNTDINLFVSLFLAGCA